jgi:hypothetical protein
VPRCDRGRTPVTIARSRPDLLILSARLMAGFGWSCKNAAARSWSSCLEALARVATRAVVVMRWYDKNSP